MSAFDTVTIARTLKRPTALQFIDAIFRDFIEFHGDRYFKDDKAVVGGIARISGLPVTVIGIQKGQTLEENIFRNFASVSPEGYRKALRLMKQAEKFKRPIITFINTQGAYCGADAEERGQGEAIAKNLMEMAMLKVPIIAIIIGEGGSGGALALAVSDRVWMLKNAVYSILSPEGFASILWKDSGKAKEAAEFMKLTSKDLLELNIIDKIIDEHRDGIEKNFEFTTRALKDALKSEIKLLNEKEVSDLVEERYQRFRKFGEYVE